MNPWRQSGTPPGEILGILATPCGSLWKCEGIPCSESPCSRLSTCHQTPLLNTGSWRGPRAGVARKVQSSRDRMSNTARARLQGTCGSGFRQCIEDYAPDMVVSVHPLLQTVPLQVCTPNFHVLASWQSTSPQKILKPLPRFSASVYRGLRRVDLSSRGGAHQGQTSREGERDMWWTAGTTRGGTGHLGLTHTETQRGRLWT